MAQHLNFKKLKEYFENECLKCLRDPVDRFRHRWIAPMPLSKGGEAYFVERGIANSFASLANQNTAGDGFTTGDYSLGLFHHDASESAIWHLECGSEELRDGAVGSLLNLLECASADGCIHRVELPYKTRETEPSKPVMAQFARRCAESLEKNDEKWPKGWTTEGVYERVVAFVQYLERNYVGVHGLFLTHSSLQSGFDSDLLTASLPEKTVEGPDTNAFMVLEYEALAELAFRVNRKKEREAWQRRSCDLKDRLNDFCWMDDGDEGYYVALRSQRGDEGFDAQVVSTPDADKKRPLETWASLLPLYAGVPDPAKAKKLIERLTNEDKYWSKVGVRTQAAKDIYFSQSPRVMLYDHKKHDRGPVSNWTGPVWVLSNYYMAEGCHRYKMDHLAADLAIKTATLLQNDVNKEGKLQLHENYNDEGFGLWPCGETFLSWNVLALTLLERYVNKTYPSN